MSNVITVDDSLWPLVVFRFTGVMTAVECERFFDYAVAYLERGEKYICITDMTQMSIPALAQCRQLAEWLRKYDAQMRERVLGNALVVTTAPIRLSLSLVFHLKLPPMPHVAVSDMDAAVSFVVDKLREAELFSEAERIQRHYDTSAPGLHVA